ncbi:MAG TPA: M14 family metallopeptidase [Candidatus Paceibacterota bacterium]|nr:M14 family metallopeptidase [Candidatus Paceibacterota bacterium]
MKPLFIGRLIIISVLVVALIAWLSISFIFWRNPSEILPTSTPEATNFVERNVIGQSVEGREIEAYTFGQGDTHLIFVGGIHGGYEWNSVLLAYKFIDYLEANPDFLPKNLTVTIIPSANPDGLFSVVGKEGRFKVEDVSTNQQVLVSGRLNANEVDLNRNFDCKWQAESSWRGESVSGGAKVFSEPEAVALRDFVLKHRIAGAIFWHSQAGAVYASECERGVLPKTLELMKAYAQASGYKAVESFDSYDVTGDAEGWLASLDIPAITVELKTHESLDWEQNLAGVGAIWGLF